MITLASPLVSPAGLLVSRDRNAVESPPSGLAHGLGQAALAVLPGVLLASGSTGLSGRSASARGLSGSRIGPIVPHLPPRRRGPAVPCRPSARNLGLVTSRSAIVRGRQGRAGGDGCQCAAAQRRSAGD